MTGRLGDDVGTTGMAAEGAGPDAPHPFDGVAVVIENRDGAAAVDLPGAAAEYFLARQPEGTIAALRFVPVSLERPDGMEYLRILGAETLHFADRVVRAAGVPAETTVADALADAAAVEGFSATAGCPARLDVLAHDGETGGLHLRDVEVIDGAGSAEVVDNVISFNAAAAGLVRLRYTVEQGEETATAEVTVDVGANLNAVPGAAGEAAAGQAAALAGAAETVARRFSLSVTAVEDGPVLTGAGAPVAYVKTAGVLLIAPDLTLADRGGATLSAARVEIGGALPEDRLVVANWRPENGQSTTMGNVTLHYTNGVLLLAGIAALAEYQGLLRQVGYASAAERPEGAPRGITMSVEDGSAPEGAGRLAVVAEVEIGAEDAAASGWLVRTVPQAAAPAGAEMAVTDALPVPGDQVGSGPAGAGPMAAGGGAALTLPAAQVVAEGQAAVSGGTLVGTAQADALSTSGKYAVLGLGGDDRITLTADSMPEVTVDGGSGIDTLVIGPGVAAYGPAEDAALLGIEVIEIETAEGAAIDLSKQGEGFTVRGGAGDDSVTGGAGDDVFLGLDGDGMDVWIGGAGTDTISFDGVEAAVHIDLARGTVQGVTVGSDTVVSIENATGGRADDILLGGDGANRLQGGAGADLIRGGDGDDTIEGGSGNDRIFGGRGQDVLTGGEGEDVFCFSGPDQGTDIITDFQPGDRIELTASEFLRGLSNEQVANGSWFFRGLVANDLDDRLIFDRDSGHLVYDSNGSEDGGTVVQIARFDWDEDASGGSGGHDLDWLDFLIT